MITIYSKENCSQCFVIQKLCERKKVDFVVKKLDADFSQEELNNLTEGKARSYPQVFNKDLYVGDFTAAQKLIMSGKF